MCRRWQWLAGADVRERGREVSERDHVEIWVTNSGCCGRHSGEERQEGHGYSSNRIKRDFDGTLQ